MATNFLSGPVKRSSGDEPLRYEDAAKMITVEGWACVKCGHFYGNHSGAEHSARYCCHTDAPCACGARKSRHKATCEKCWHAKKVGIWTGLEQRAWAEPAMLTTYDGDAYFEDPDELIEWCIEHEVKPSDAFVIHTKEHAPPQFDLSDYLTDYLPEDQEFLHDQESREAEENVNAVLQSLRPLSWGRDPKARPTDAELAAWDAEYEKAIRE